MCTCVLTQLRELALSVPEALGWEEKEGKDWTPAKNGILISQKFPSVCVQKVGMGGRGASKGWENGEESRGKRTEIMTFRWTASVFSWRLLVKITNHNVIRKSMGTIKVIITVQCMGAVAKLPLTLPLSPQQIIALDNLNRARSCPNTLHTSPCHRANCISKSYCATTSKYWLDAKHAVCARKPVSKLANLIWVIVMQRGGLTSAVRTQFESRYESCCMVSFRNLSEDLCEEKNEPNSKWHTIGQQ